MRAKLIYIAVILSIVPVLVFGAKAPDFAVTDFNNKVHKLYDDYLNKDKVVVIKFFFVGCPPCAAVAPQFQQAYVRWGSGSGRVQFFEITTTNDNNSLVKSYHNTKGFTFPGIGIDGGAQAARSPYTSGTFGAWYGTPTFVVIDPTGEVNYRVSFTTSDQSKLDTAIAQALRVNQGGGGCSNAFSVKTITQLQPETYYVVDLLNGNPANEIKTGSYNCEFTLPQNIDGHYVIPQINAIAEPLTGVSTADIVQIQRSILGLQTLNNLQRAVADVNNSSTVSAADISEIKKLILGRIPAFSKLTKSYAVVHNPKSINPFDLTDRVLVKDLVAETKTNVFGVGKFGDVTGANLFKNDELETRSSDAMKFTVEMRRLENGNYEHRFYAEEDFNLTAFQFELTGTANNFINMLHSSKFADVDFDYSLNVSPTQLRMLALPRNSQDIHFAAGEIWFTVLTKSPDRLQPSTLNKFIHEFLFDQRTKYTGTVEIEYLITALQGESVTVTTTDHSELIISSERNIQQVRILNSNGYLLNDKFLVEQTNQLNIPIVNFQTGIYFAQVKLDNGRMVTKKFVKLAK
jgi:thiol-disulfide isomerase/thioredoxin